MGFDKALYLFPTLFNIYMSDMTETIKQKFVYADDLGLTALTQSFKELEMTLTFDLKIMEYFQKWQLRPNTSKLVVSTFNFDNRNSQNALTVKFCGETVL